LWKKEKVGGGGVVLKKLISIALIISLITTSIPPRAVEASFLSDVLGAWFTVITAPIWIFCQDNPTFRKNNPFRKKMWEEESELEEARKPKVAPFRKKLWEEESELEEARKLKKEAENKKKQEEAQAKAEEERLLRREDIVRKGAIKDGYSQAAVEKIVALVRKHNGYRTLEYIEEVREIQFQDVAAREGTGKAKDAEVKRLLASERSTRARAIKEGFLPENIKKLVEVNKKYNGHLTPEARKEMEEIRRQDVAAREEARRQEEARAADLKTLENKLYNLGIMSGYTSTKACLIAKERINEAIAGKYDFKKLIEIADKIADKLIEEKAKEDKVAKEAEEAKANEERLLAGEDIVRKWAIKEGNTHAAVEKIVALVRKHNGYESLEFEEEYGEIARQDVAAREEVRRQKEAHHWEWIQYGIHRGSARILLVDSNGAAVTEYTTERKELMGKILDIVERNSCDAYIISLMSGGIRYSKKLKKPLNNIFTVPLDKSVNNKDEPQAQAILAGLRSQLTDNITEPFGYVIWNPDATSVTLALPSFRGFPNKEKLKKGIEENFKVPEHSFLFKDIPVKEDK
jgi:hypothetical protein